MIDSKGKLMRLYLILLAIHLFCSVFCIERSELILSLDSTLKSLSIKQSQKEALTAAVSTFSDFFISILLCYPKVNSDISVFTFDEDLHCITTKVLCCLKKLLCDHPTLLSHSVIPLSSYRSVFDSRIFSSLQRWRFLGFTPVPETALSTLQEDFSAAFPEYVEFLCILQKSYFLHFFSCADSFEIFLNFYLHAFLCSTAESFLATVLFYERKLNEQVPVNNFYRFAFNPRLTEMCLEIVKAAAEFCSKSKFSSIAQINPRYYMKPLFSNLIFFNFANDELKVTEQNNGSISFRYIRPFTESIYHNIPKSKSDEFN